MDNWPIDKLTVDVVLEILELLKTPPHERTNKAPVGSLGSSHFESDWWTLYLWKYPWLHSHDYNVATGQLVSTILFPIDVFDRAQAFAKTFARFS